MIISIATVEDIDTIKTICDVQLGQDYISRHRIVTANISIVAIDEREYPTKIIGWSAADVINEKLGQLSHCVVRPGYEGRGVATRLVQERLRILAFRDIKNCVSYCWQHPDGKIPMEGILKKFEFSPVKVMKNAFKCRTCTICGKNCACDCVVFLKKGF